MKTNFYENNGGMIYAIVFDDEKIVNIIYGFEDQMLTLKELIELAKEGFPYSDEFEPDKWSNCTMKEVFERSTEDDLIAEITEECVKLYPENMGISGRELFGIEQYEEE
jgi:hypothetical protein